MKTSARGWPPKASIAAAPVSPEVAPRIVARAPRSRQRAVHRAAEPLHGEILERERRPVEQLEQRTDCRRSGPAAPSRRGGSRHRRRAPSRRVRRAANRRRRTARSAASPLRHRAGPARARISPPGRASAALAAHRVRRRGRARRASRREAERRRLAARRKIVHELEIPGRCRRLAQKAPKENGGRTWSYDWGQSKTKRQAARWGLEKSPNFS